MDRGVDKHFVFLTDSNGFQISDYLDEESEKGRAEGREGAEKREEEKGAGGEGRGQRRERKRRERGRGAEREKKEGKKEERDIKRKG